MSFPEEDALATVWPVRLHLIADKVKSNNPDCLDRTFTKKHSACGFFGVCRASLVVPFGMFMIFVPCCRQLWEMSFEKLNLTDQRSEFSATWQHVYEPTMICELGLLQGCLQTVSN